MVADPISCGSEIIQDASTLKSLIDEVERQRALRRPAVLATIIETRSSTYRKAGARMLITQDDRFVGLLGGGCFEGDLIENARPVFKDGTARVVLYDMRGSEDVIWGLGLGCDGAVQILLQRLDSGNGYQPMGYVTAAAGLRQTLCLAVVCKADDAALVGRTVAVKSDATEYVDPDLGSDKVAALISSRVSSLFSAGSGTTVMHHAGGFGEIEVFYDVIEPPPHLLIAGAGPDAVPVACLAASLGWQVSVVDHREAYAQNDRFPDVGCVAIAEAGKFPPAINLAEINASVVMSHHFETDQRYLQQLAASPVSFVGLLGPLGRREALLEALGAPCTRSLSGRLHGPVGLDIGAETPEEIALSIVSGIHAALRGRAGEQLKITQAGAQNRSDAEQNHGEHGERVRGKE